MTDSDRRKYRELFAKVIANESTTSLPVLSAMSTVQSKPKFIKGSLPTTLIDETLIADSSSTLPMIANSKRQVTSVIKRTGGIATGRN